MPTVPGRRVGPIGLPTATGEAHPVLQGVGAVGRLPPLAAPAGGWALGGTSAGGVVGTGGSVVGGAVSAGGVVVGTVEDDVGPVRFAPARHSHIQVSRVAVGSTRTWAVSV